MIRNASIPRLLIAVLAITMLVVALACASEEEPTVASTAVSTPTTSEDCGYTVWRRTANGNLGGPTLDTDLGWMDSSTKAFSTGLPGRVV